MVIEVINAPKRGIGKATVEKAVKFANNNNITL